MNFLWIPSRLVTTGKEGAIHLTMGPLFPVLQRQGNSYWLPHARWILSKSCDSPKGRRGNFRATLLQGHWGDSMGPKKSKPHSGGPGWERSPGHSKTPKGTDPRTELVTPGCPSLLFAKPAEACSSMQPPPRVKDHLHYLSPQRPCHSLFRAHSEFSLLSNILL